MSAVSTPVLLSAVLLMLVLPDVSLGWGSSSPSRSRLLQLQRLRVSRSDYREYDDDDDDDVDDDYPSRRRDLWRSTRRPWDRDTTKLSTIRTIGIVDIDDDDDYLDDYDQYRYRAFSRLRQLRDDYYRNRKSGSGGSDDYNDYTHSPAQRRAVWGGRQANDRGMNRLYARLRQYLETGRQ